MPANLPAGSISGRARSKSLERLTVTTTRCFRAAARCPTASQHAVVATHDAWRAARRFSLFAVRSRWTRCLPGRRDPSNEAAKSAAVASNDELVGLRSRRRAAIETDARQGRRSLKYGKSRSTPQLRCGTTCRGPRSRAGPERIQAGAHLRRSARSRHGRARLPRRRPSPPLGAHIQPRELSRTGNDVHRRGRTVLAGGVWTGALHPAPVRRSCKGIRERCRQYAAAIAAYCAG